MPRDGTSIRVSHETRARLEALRAQIPAAGRTLGELVGMLSLASVDDVVSIFSAAARPARYNS